MLSISFVGCIGFDARNQNVTLCYERVPKSNLYRLFWAQNTTFVETATFLQITKLPPQIKEFIPNGNQRN
jgi:hypothetical protein